MARLSLEFFPPRQAEGLERLVATARRLQPLQPDYVSVTFGAGGSTQEGTLTTAQRLRQDTGLAVAPHLSCIGLEAQATLGLLQRYQSIGLRRLVVIRGDRPSGVAESGPFHHALDMVRFVRQHTGDAFTIHVAGYPDIHPEASSAASDITHLVHKVQAGGNGIITQYFYNADAYFRLVEDIHRMGVTVPVVPGIMPITHAEQLLRFSARCGAEIPRWLALRLKGLEADPPGLKAFGLEVVASLCQRLLDGGAPGLHIYTLNHAEPVLALGAALGLEGSGGRAAAPDGVACEARPPSL
jgi:methylenetetrahydrofolate reductase (NADPH)